MNKSDLAVVLKHFPKMDSLVADPQLTLGEYYKNIDSKLSRPKEPLPKLLTDEIFAYLAQIIGVDSVTKKQVQHELDELELVSTAEHHASILHPETLNLVLNQLITAQTQDKKAILCLSCATTKLDNELFPRGILINEHKIPFFSNRYTKYFVSNVEKINEPYFFDNLNRYLTKMQLPVGESNEMLAFMRNFFARARFFNTYSQQVTLLNYQLFKAIFKDIAPEVDYYMVPAEEIIAQVLLKESTNKKKTWLYKLIF